MNPRASDRVRGFQDTIIVVGDVLLAAILVRATLGAETNGFNIVVKYEYYTYLVLW